MNIFFFNTAIKHITFLWEKTILILRRLDRNKFFFSLNNNFFRWGVSRFVGQGGGDGLNEEKNGIDLDCKDIEK